MAQDSLAQDSMTNDFYLQILCVEHPYRSQKLFHTLHKKICEKCVVLKLKSLVIESWAKESSALEFTTKTIDRWM